MTETLPRSFTLSTVAHGLLVVAGLALAARGAPQTAQLLSTPLSMMEVPLDIEPPRAPPPPPPPAAAPPPPPPVAAHVPRVASAPAPVAPQTVAPQAPPSPAPAAPASVATSEGGDTAMATTTAAPSAAPTAVVAPARAGEGTAAPQVEGPVFDSGAYLAGVSDRVRRHRNYPAIAQEMGIEGVVEVRVVVAPDGSLAAPPTIDASCGHEVLDDEALRIVQRAAPFAPIVGRSERVTLRVPVRFHLDV
jgi:protein TonB